MSLIVRAVGRGLVFALAASALVAACDDAPAPKAPAQAASADKPKRREAALPPQMVAAVSSGKTATVVSVHFALQASPSVGKPLPVDIAIVAHQPFASIHALFESPEAVPMSTGNRFEQQKDVKAETVLSHKLLLQPSEEGVFLVTAAVETEGDEGSVTRIYSIPIIVHAPTTAAPATKPVTTPAASPAQG